MTDSRPSTSHVETTRLVRREHGLSHGRADTTTGLIKVQLWVLTGVPLGKLLFLHLCQDTPAACELRCAGAIWLGLTVDTSGKVTGVEPGSGLQRVDDAPAIMRLKFWHVICVYLR